MVMSDLFSIFGINEVCCFYNNLQILTSFPVDILTLSTF